MSANQSPWDAVFSAMREDERMRAGKDRTLFAKEHRQDAEQMRRDADLNACGIAFFQSVKPTPKEPFQ